MKYNISLRTTLASLISGLALPTTDRYKKLYYSLSQRYSGLTKSHHSPRIAI